MLLTVTGLVSQLLGFFYRIALSRLIGAEMMGLYQLVMPVYGVVLSLTATGITVAVSTLTSSYHARGNQVAMGQLIRRCVTLFCLFFFPVALIVVVCYDPISVYLLGDARTQTGLILLLPCIFLTGIENLHKHFFYGTSRVTPAATVEFIEQLIRIGGVLGLLLIFLPQNAENTVALIVVGMIGCEIFSVIALLTLYRRYRQRGGGLQGEAISSANLNQAIAGVAIPVGATAVLGNLMASANAVLIPKRLVEGGYDVTSAMEAFGVICGMTLPMLMLPTAFIGAMGLVLVPKLAQSTALGRKGEICHRVGRAMKATSTLILPAMALLVVVGPTVGVLLFQEATVGQYITPLSIGVALSCYHGVLGGCLNGVGKQGTAAIISLLCGGVQLGCTFFFMAISSVGLFGYVIGFVASSVLGVSLCWWQVKRYTGMTCPIFTWWVAPGLAALLTGLVSNLLFLQLGQVGMDTIPQVVVTLLFGGILYVVALMAQGQLKH